MAIRKKWLGLSQDVICDRCNKKLSEDYCYAVCKDCAKIPPQEIYKDDLIGTFQYALTPSGKCCICKKEFSWHNLYHVCENCISSHPANDHNYMDRGHVHCCTHCGGLYRQVGDTKTKIVKRVFYNIGSRIPTSKPSPCRKNSKLDVNHFHCYHDWVEIENTVKPYNEGLKEYRKLRKESNALRDIVHLEEEIIDVIDASIAFGDIGLWCSKCGYYISITPHRGEEAPVYGVGIARK